MQKSDGMGPAIRRRHFLELAALAAVTRETAALLPSYDVGIAFFVAGVRFHAPRVRPKINDTVIIKSNYTKSQIGYEIITMRGERIGFVPHTLISAFRDFDRLEAKLTLVDEGAVPWKKYQITIRI